jgi:NAD(P) transhydrogenase
MPGRSDASSRTANGTGRLPLSGRHSHRGKASGERRQYITGFRRRDVYGLRLTLDPEATLAQLRTRTAQVIETMTEAVRINLERHAIEFVRGRARLGSDRTVHVGVDAGQERVLNGDVVLIATGSRPFRPPDIPFDDRDVHDSTTVLEIDRPFGSIVVVGGGAVACEYASVFTALGMEVTLVAAGRRLLPFLDGEISELLAQTFSGMGMRVVLGAGNAAVTRDGKVLRITLASGEDIAPDKALFAAGRACLPTDSCSGNGRLGAVRALPDRPHALLDASPSDGTRPA